MKKFTMYMCVLMVALSMACCTKKAKPPEKPSEAAEPALPEDAGAVEDATTKVKVTVEVKKEEKVEEKTK